MVYGYIRVSTDKQTVENQRYEIVNYCQQKGLSVDAWIEETVSGTVAPKTRKLGRALKRMHSGDLLICAELSRLGRSLLMIMGILDCCMARQIEVRSIKDHFRLGNDIASKVLAFAFGLSAEIERNLISQRTREALARRRAEGMTLGRQRGSRNLRLKLSGREKVIRERLASGSSLSQLARELHVHRNTLHRFLLEGHIPLYMCQSDEI